MSRGGNDLNELTWARITSASAFSSTSIIAAKAGFIAKVFRVIVASLAANQVFFEQATTKIGPQIEIPATEIRQFECEFEAPVGVAITADSSATTTLTLFVGYKYISANVGN